MSTFTDDTASQVLDFWFDKRALDRSYSVDMDGAMRWFRRTDEFDAACYNFKHIVTSLAATYTPPTITSLATTPRRTLALLILLDQLSRNIFRGAAAKEVFTVYDPLAQAVATHSASQEPPLDYGENNEWKTAFMIRVWFLMPLMHSESAELHKKGLAGLDRIEGEMKEAGAGEGEGDGQVIGIMHQKTREAFLEHVEVVERFGRYVHRDKALGRETSEEEREWLEKTEYMWAKP